MTERILQIECVGGGPIDGLTLKWQGVPPSMFTYHRGGNDHLYEAAITWNGAVLRYRGIVGRHCEGVKTCP